MTLHLYYEDTSFRVLNPSLLDIWVDKVIQLNYVQAEEITVIFTSDSFLLDMNIHYLSHDFLTDIITFDYSQDQVISGDLFISVEMIQFNANRYQVPFLTELLRVIAHGILHLMNYNDKTPEEQLLMKAKEDESIRLFEDDLSISGI